LSILEEMIINSILNLVVQGILIGGTFYLARKSVTDYQKRKDVSEIRNNLLSMVSQLSNAHNLTNAAFNHLRVFFFNKNHEFNKAEQLMIRNDYIKHHAEVNSHLTHLFFRIEYNLYPNLDASKIEEIEKCFNLWKEWASLLVEGQKENPVTFNPKYKELDYRISEGMKNLLKTIIEENINV